MDAWGQPRETEGPHPSGEKDPQMRPEITHMTKANLFISQNRGGTCAHDGDRDVATLSFKSNRIA